MANSLKKLFTDHGAFSKAFHIASEQEVNIESLDQGQTAAVKCGTIHIHGVPYQCALLIKREPGIATHKPEIPIEVTEPVQQIDVPSSVQLSPNPAAQQLSSFTW